MATLALALVCRDRPARAEERPESFSSTVRTERVRPLFEPRPAPELLPSLVRGLPKSTPIALYVPTIDVAFGDLDRARRTLDLVDRSLSRRILEKLAAKAFGLDRAPAGELSSWIPGMRDASAVPSWSELLTAQELSGLGVDPSGSAILVRGVNEDALVAAFALSSRPRFQHWLSRMSGGELGHVELAGEEASVLGPDSDRPITCLSRQSIAYCQIGLVTGSDPIAALRAVVLRAAPGLDQVSGLVRAFGRLPDGAHAYLFVNSDPAVKLASKLIAQHAQKKHRFDAPAARRRAQEREIALTQDARIYGENVEAAVLGLYVGERGDLAVRAELALSDRGTKLARELNAERRPGDVIARWSDTPSLARVLIRMREDQAQQMFAALGFPVPDQTMSGTLALLMFGIDTECPLAKKEARANAGIGWAFLLPSALAIGVKAPKSAEAVQAVLKNAIEKDARAAGSSFDVRVHEDMVLVGTGPGSGAAAVRRFGGLPPPRPKRSDEPLPFLEGSINPRAVDAALGAGDFDDEHRAELLLLSRLRVRLKPLVEQVSAVTLNARAIDRERRVRVDFEVKR